MPDTYQIKLSDGRTFNVTTEGGPPSEADVLANLDKLTTSTPSAVMQPSAGRGTQFDPELANRRFPSVLPIAGGIVGGLAGGPLVGASVGTAIGEGARQTLSGEPLDLPQMGAEGAITLAFGAGIKGLQGAAYLARTNPTLARRLIGVAFGSTPTGRLLRTLGHLNDLATLLQETPSEAEAAATPAVKAGAGAIDLTPPSPGQLVLTDEQAALEGQRLKNEAIIASRMGKASSAEGKAAWDRYKAWLATQPKP
jgi:hypothetical protein